MLVDDQRQVNATGAHLLEELRGPLARGHGQRGPDEALEPRRRPGQRGVVHVPGVDEPEHVVDLALEHRVAGVAGLADGPDRLRERGLRAQRGDPGPWRHDLAHVALVELDRAGHDALLHDALPPGLLRDGLEVLQRVEGQRVGALLAEQAQEDARREGQRRDRGADQPADPLDHRGHPQGQGLGVAHGQGLGDELPHHERQVGDREDHDPDGDRLGERPSARARAAPAIAGSSRSMAATPPTAEASVPTRVTPTCTVARKRSGSSLRRRAAAARGLPLLRQGPQARGAGAHHRHLRPGEEGVEEDQDPDQGQLDDEPVFAHGAILARAPGTA